MIDEGVDITDSLDLTCLRRTPSGSVFKANQQVLTIRNHPNSPAFMGVEGVLQGRLIKSSLK